MKKKCTGSVAFAVKIVAATVMKKKSKKPPNPKTIRFETRKAALVLTEHFRERQLERLSEELPLPQPGTHVRVFQVQDTLHHKKIWILKIKEGAILAKWAGQSKLMLLTVLTTEILDRLQHRKISRFVPLDSLCIQITNVFSSKEEFHNQHVA